MKLASKIFRRTDWYVTSSFGWRTYWYQGKQVTDYHNGTDYGTNGQKWPQYALEDGYVRSCGTDSTGGKFVYVCYPRIGKELLHYHLDSISVKNGQAVKEGTLLGYTGTTGKSTGIHLHLGLRNIGSSTWENPHLYEYIEGTNPPSPPPQPGSELNIGDTVVLNGRLYADSYGGGAGKTVTNHTGKITHKNMKGSKPYHIDRLGWVAASDVVKNGTTSTAIKVGDTVIVNGIGTANSQGGGATTKNYVNVRAKVINIANGRYALNLNNNMNGVTGWFTSNSIKKA